MKPGATLALLLLASVSTGQIAYPDLVVQDVDWSSGVHAYAVTQGILAPAVAELPVNMEETAEVEFVSARHVHLTPGFHAGDFVNEGFFHARIDEAAGPAGDIVVVAPDPVEHVVDQVLHVPKWEKLEVGLQLPQEYKDAIDRFFANYYSNGTAQAATPAAVNDTYDLNPYADDSLQLVMRLIDPEGQQRMKWGFFMREAKWDETAPDPDEAILVEHSSSPFHPYHVRFRFAPDKEGPWQFTLSLKAPHTITLANEPLPHLVYTGNNFVCDPPLEDNKGYLQVNEANRRILQFENGDPFFGLGTNMADARNITYPWYDPGWYTFHQSTFNAMQQSMEELHSVGGNFLRMFLLRHIFAPEWVNLGVYDHYKVPPQCDDGGTLDYVSNCQYQSWAFDKMLDQARANNIYIQLCIDPYPPIIALEHLWGGHPYLLNYLEPHRDADGMYPMREFFYEDGLPTNTDQGVFYYWKRKYKYLMARWGYSVNIASLEPFNEIDQMLRYQYNDLSNPTSDLALCEENEIEWLKDDGLPEILNDWLTDIIDYVREPADPTDPVDSPLGEEKKLFVLSFTDAVAHDAANSQEHYLPFTNPKLDLMDVHKYAWPNQSQEDSLDHAMFEGFEHAQGFRTSFPSTDPTMERKPFNHGEFNYFTKMAFGDQEHDIEKYFHNYDVSFHNEIWSSAFSGKFAAGTTWFWERVFWWKDALKRPPHPNNQYQLTPPSNVLGATNMLDIGLGVGFPITNRTLHHHFKPLADLLRHPTWHAYQFFNADYTAHRVFDESNVSELEAYYLKDTTNTFAIGWVHNRNAWVMNSYYLQDTIHNFLGCEHPDSTKITLTGFLPNAPFYITWFPTRMDTTTYPLAMTDTSSAAGNLTFDLAGYFGGTVNNYMDTLRSDYAFIITPEIFDKSMPSNPIVELPPAYHLWDFELYPNPARDVLFLRMPNHTSKEVEILDVSGRRILHHDNVTSTTYQLSTVQLAKGAYWVRVRGSTNVKVKKLIIH